MCKKFKLVIAVTIFTAMLSLWAYWAITQSPPALPVLLEARPDKTDERPLVWWSEVSQSGYGTFTTTRLDLHAKEYALNVLINPAGSNAPEDANARLESPLSMAKVGGFLAAVNATPYTLPNKTPQETESWRTFLPGTNVSLRGFSQARNQERIGLEPAAPSYPILWQNRCGEVHLSSKEEKIDPVWALSAYHWILQDGEIFKGALPYTERTNRAAAGISADGRWFYLVVCGPADRLDEARNSGASLPELATFMRSIGVSNALNFDGGSSTGMVIRQSESYLLLPPPEKIISRPIPVMLGVTSAPPES